MSDIINNTSAGCAHWIWYNGDFELYHSMKLHTRRQEYGIEYPPFWGLSAPYPNIHFRKSFSTPEEFSFAVAAPEGSCCFISVGGKRYNRGEQISLPAGNYTIEVNLLVTSGFPCIYISGKYLITDSTWEAAYVTTKYLPVGDKPYYTDACDDPTVFKFSYETLTPVNTEKHDNGILYDYGRETFCRMTVDGVLPEDEILLYYGESREEALDTPETLVYEKLTGGTHYVITPHALRYLNVIADVSVLKKMKLTADFEYLPLKDMATFECNRKNIGKIYDICAYTFHLNSREFYLDGIKRDRWVWSGDAYQSYMANRYLYSDPDITKRTIIALLGKPPYSQHINTINDYTMYLLIGVYEYYEATGDAEFICIYYDRLRALYDFLASRVDDNGYICQRPGDWIFIDWSDMDKSGPLCAEQILFWRTMQVMSKLSSIAGHDGSAFDTQATVLKKKIIADFWREDKGAFIDCASSGKEHITRHANIFAILYDFVTHRRAIKIVHNVLDNQSVTPITTPYFEFFELCARCKTGDIKSAQKKIDSYWGGMVNLGATSIWEEYIPENTGIGHYSMYGMKYGCSLCHAWGSGPIYLLGRYCLGVYPTSTAYKTFRVEPDRGLYKFIRGTVPLANGNTVSVYADAKTVKVSATVAGGILSVKGVDYAIPVGEELTVTTE